MLQFVTALRAAGKLRLRTVALRYSERRGEFPVEGGRRIYSPSPEAASARAADNPNNFDELRHLRSTGHPSDRRPFVVLLVADAPRAPDQFTTSTQHHVCA